GRGTRLGRHSLDPPQAGEVQGSPRGDRGGVFTRRVEARRYEPTLARAELDLVRGRPRRPVGRSSPGRTRGRAITPDADRGTPPLATRAYGDPGGAVRGRRRARPRGA